MNNINLIGWPLPKSSTEAIVRHTLLQPPVWPRLHPHVMPASVYTTFVGKQIHALAKKSKFKSALDMGAGSGFLTVSLCEENIHSITVVDILDEALYSTKALIDNLSYASIVSYINSDLWSKLSSLKYDLIVCNPPSLPCRKEFPTSAERHWYNGGQDGHEFISRFILGLTDHLENDGVALLAHTSLSDIERTFVECRTIGLDITAEDYMDFPFRDFYFNVIPESILNHGESKLFYKYGGQHFERVWILSIRHTTHKGRKL